MTELTKQQLDEIAKDASYRRNGAINNTTLDGKLNLLKYILVIIKENEKSSMEYINIVLGGLEKEIDVLHKIMKGTTK